MVQELDVPHHAQLILDMNAHGVDHLLQVLVLVLNHAEMVFMILEKNVMRAVQTAPLMPVHQHAQKILVILVYGLDIHLVAQAHAQSYLLIVVMESLILEKYAMMVTMMILMVAQMVAIKLKVDGSVMVVHQHHQIHAQKYQSQLDLMMTALILLLHSITHVHQQVLHQKM